VSCVLQLRILPPYKGGARCTTYPIASDPVSLQGRVPMCHMLCSSGPCLPIREGSGVPRVLQLLILPLYRGGLRSVMCPTIPDPTSLSGGLRCCHRMPCVSYGSHASNIKKSLECISMQQGSSVPNARTHISKVFDVRAIMSL
jgi:hypothetical protein